MLNFRAMNYAHVKERVAEIRGMISEAVSRGGHNQEVQIVAVTKTHGIEAVEAAWEAGLEICGENRVQEALSKISAVSVPVRWHLIGHLQRNKVEALDHFALLHSLDSSRLADSINKYGVKRGHSIDCLVQVNTSGEESKGGFTLDELLPEADRLVSAAGVKIVGAMTMAPIDASEAVLRKTFSGARKAREILQAAGHPAVELSMGMSGDFAVAVEEGATLVRLGTSIFGVRE